MKRLLNPFAGIRKFPNRLAQKFKIKVYILSEKDPRGIPFSMMYAGYEGNKNYLANVIFGDNYKTIETSKIWIWNLGRKINDNRRLCNLIIMKDNKNVRRFVDTKKMFALPVWIGWKVDISGEISAIVKQDKSLQSDIRRIRKNKLTFEVTNNETDFEEFYQKMYIPYITSVHGDQASLTTYDDMKNHFAECDLIVVGKDKDKMGGMLIRYENDMPRLWSIGVTDARVDYLRAGVIGALYYFSVIHLKEKGHDAVHYGATRAFLNDGVLRYKKKWGVQIANQPKNVFLIQIESISSKLKAFLSKNPFIHMEEGILQGAVFINSTEPPSDVEIQRFGKDYFLKGLSGLNLYLFGHDRQSLEAYNPQKSSDKISIHPADVFFK